MQQPTSDSLHDEPPTTLGPDSGSPDETVTLPEGALSNGCYVAGDGTQFQTSLLQSWCVEWAEAGQGFCYLHPTGAAPIELLKRLPEDRLDDVVWIDFNRGPYSDYDLETRHRVQINPYEVLDPAPVLGGFDPVGQRINAVLEMAREQTELYNWNVARIISAVLPPVLQDDVTSELGQLEALDRALSRLSRRGDIDSQVARLGLERDDPTVRQLRAAALHSKEDVHCARRLLTSHRNGDLGHPVRGPTTYDVGRALAEDHILLVTAAIPTARTRSPRRPVQLGARLFVAAICCRLLAAAQPPVDVTRAFPLVVDGVRPFVADDGALLADLLEYATHTPLAPVLGGRPISFLTDRLETAVTEYTASRIATPDPDLAIDPDGLLMQAFQADPGRPDYWDDPMAQVDPRVNTTSGEPPNGYLATTAAIGSEDRPQAHAYQPSPPPEVRHDKATVTDAIDRSVQRYGRVMRTVTDNVD